MNCEVCGSESIEPVLDLGNQPLCDDLVSLDSTRVCRFYPIQISLCLSCGTALQNFQVDRTTLFPSEYHYRAKRTPSVLQSMQDLVLKTMSYISSTISDPIVLDIGCNDGALLDFFNSSGCRTFGIDPTNAASEAALNHHVLQDYFDTSSSQRLLELIGRKPDVITFTNCFAHINNFSELSNALKVLLDQDTILVIENHYLGSVLASNQFDTFYHEHPRTYSFRSFSSIASTLDLKIFDCVLTSRYGGNIQVFMSRNANSTTCFVTEPVDHLLGQFRAMSSYIPNWKKTKLEAINSAVSSHGPLKGIGFPGRASILINLLGLDSDALSATFEIAGSIKTGYYIPGTRIPILPESELFDLPDFPDLILNLAWHIEEDVIRNLYSYGRKPSLLSLM